MSTMVGTLSPARPRRRAGRLVKGLVATFALASLAAVAIPLYSNIWGRTDAAKVLADTRKMVSAIALYEEHTGRLPAALRDLTRITINSWEDSAGPFLTSVPTPPAGATEYRYEVRPDGRSYKLSVTLNGRVIEADRNGVRETAAAR